MAWYDRFRRKNISGVDTAAEAAMEVQQEQKNKELVVVPAEGGVAIDKKRALPKASFMAGGVYRNSPTVYAVFDGEKTLGGMGPIKEYTMDYYALRARSWQLYRESEPCFIIINKYIMWVIGTELSLQSEPQTEVLKDEGININSEEFNEKAESKWKVYSASKKSDYSGQRSLHAHAGTCLRDILLGGDTLVVLRVEGNWVKTELINGALVCDPPDASVKQNDGLVQGADTSGYDLYLPNGNRVRRGVEIDAKGSHVAYHVRTASYKWERIPAYGARSGMRMAYMTYRDNPEVGATRCDPLISVVMQTAKKLERYGSAALGGAEERQKIAYFFEHGVKSNQENPMGATRTALASAGFSDELNDIPVDADANEVASEVAVSTEKQVFNLPNDVTIKAMESKQELEFAEFSTFHFNLICAAVGIPPDVAMGQYNDSFSASRMAGKDWEHTFMKKRGEFTEQFLKPIYELQMYVWILNGKIMAPGYLEALGQKNYMATEAYMYASWDGDKFPDIDPLKTAKYLREMLGPEFDGYPLMSMEAAAKEGGQGDIIPIFRQIQREKKTAKECGIEPAPMLKPGVTGQETGGNKDKGEPDKTDDIEEETEKE
jgi:capsid protein